MDKFTALEQLTLRLSRIADGVDEDVDEVLVSIRNTLKKENTSASEFQNLSTRLAKALLNSTGINVDKEPTIEGGYDLSGLRKLIKSMPVKGDAQDRMTEFVQRVSTGNTTIERQKALVDLLEVAVDAVRDASGGGKSDSGVMGWLGRKSGADLGDERYVALFAQLLKRLVEHIDVFNGNAVRSSSIKDALEQIVVPEQAQSLLREVTTEIEAIDAQIRAERSQTSDFLGDLRERISGFEEVLGMLTEDSQSSVTRSEELQSKVGADTKVLSDASKTSDLTTMRNLVEEGLSRISSRLAEHVKAERAQNAISSKRVAELSSRLATLESEADVLRSELRSKNDLAIKDSLTGVYNRTGYDERSVELFARWQRAGAPLSLVFVDCDKFKSVNDTYGHAAGDLVLIKVADVLSTRARVSDVVCRYGGDEFVILLPDTGVEGAEVFARSACEEVLNAGFNDNGKPLDISISCGVTTLLPNDTLETAVGRSDEAMYQAKQMTGIKVCVVV